MVEFYTVLSFIQAAGIIVGVAYYVMNIRISQRNQELMLKAQQHTLETRQVQMFLDISRQLNSKEYMVAWNRSFEESNWTNYEEFQALWKEKEFREAFSVVGTYYEGLGVLVREGFLDIRYVALLLSGATMNYWSKLNPIVEGARRATGFTRFLSESEFLYDELIKYLDGHPELKTGSYKGFSE